MTGTVLKGSVPPGSAPRLFRATGARVNPHVEWVEVQVKSVLNRVQGMPFRWSINPYRGCEHACVFCLGPETRILMADGSHKSLSEVRVGEWIYGTEVQGFYRRYVKTQVLACWETEKNAYRITLEDGTELLASGEHRFLTERGWKFVTGNDAGLPTQRPFLTINNKLMGVGAFSSSPQKNSIYMCGYLTGLIRGDGHLGTYRHRRPGRRHEEGQQFCLALTDAEALKRAALYLRDFDIPTYSYVLRRTEDQRKTVSEIRTSARSLVAAVRHITAWPTNPPLDWYKGFLAGIYDAEGSFTRGILLITNTNPTIADYIHRGLSLLGFDHITEMRELTRQKPLIRVRMLGGLRENLRLLHTVDPAIVRKRDIEGRAVKTKARLKVVSIESLDRRIPMVDITTGTGDFIANGIISHNCYARLTHWYLDQDGVNNWSSRIYVKVNAPQVLRHELARPSWQREEVHLGTATDPYQPAEGTYKISRRILEALRDFQTSVVIVTRSPMVVRDSDVLQQMAQGPGATVCFSVATMDVELAREIEPSVAPPERRLEALRTLAQAGVPTAVLLAPVLPGITDRPEQLAEVVGAAKEYGAASLWTNALHLGDVTRQAFFEYLQHKRPHLVPEYERLYRGKYAPASYRSRVQEVVAALKRQHGFHELPGKGKTRTLPLPPPQQLNLL
jgi:DNA repair photolyase